MLFIIVGLGCVIMFVLLVLIGVVVVNIGGWGYGGIFYIWGLYYFFMNEVFVKIKFSVMYFVMGLIFFFNYFF